MSIFVFIAVLFSAALHASWNALAKSNVDKHASITAIVTGQAVIGAIASPFVEFPSSESLVYAVASAFVHILYSLVLIYAYRSSDFTQVYPIARGSAPLIICLFSIVFLGLSLKIFELLGVLCIIGAILLLAFDSVGKTNTKTFRGPMLALLTGLSIATYSLIDATGVRLNHNNALSYYSWASIFEMPMLLIAMYAIRQDAIKKAIFNTPYALYIGGPISFFGYYIVIWCFTMAPIALVASLREVSVIFALLIGVLLLKERWNLIKIIATVCTLIGIIALKISA